MPDEARLIGAFTLALVTALAATPLAIAVATRTGFHDQPAGYKRHGAPTPYLGGAAVLGGFLLGVLTAVGELDRLGPIVGCTVALWALGTVDDRLDLPPLVRVAAELVAATVLWAVGLGWSLFESETVNLLVTTLWTVGLVNAFNLMDNADGAAATVGSVTALAVGVLAIIQGDIALAALCVGLSGACFGFLPYNLTAPARIFLGDGGSLPIGFALAASIMALPGGQHGDPPLILAAVLLAGLPVLDTALVVVSRRRRGVPIFRGGYDHLAHRLLGRLPSRRAVAAMLGIGQAALALVAIGVIQLGKGSIIAAWCLWFVAGAAAVGYLEARLAPAEVAREPVPSVTQPRKWAARAPTLVESGLVVAIGLMVVLSPLFSGYYDILAWGPITLVLLAVLLGLLLGRPVSPRRSALVALAGLAGLWMWSLLSSNWAESTDRALTEGNRWLFYGALLAVLVVLLRNDRLARLLIATIAVGICTFALAVVAYMIFGDGESLFLRGRLHEPLGFINAQAAFYLLGLWPLLAIAERAERWRWRWLSAPALSGAVLLAGLAVLSQTRSMAPAFAVSALLLLLIVPGRVPRALVLVVLGGAVAAVLPALLDVYESSASGERSPDPSTIRSAGLALVAAAAVAGVLWGLGARVIDGLGAGTRTTVRRAVGVGLAAVATIALLVATVTANPVDRARDEVDAFVNLRSDDGEGSRLGSGGGNRYDYWRIAVDQFRGQPLHGVGSGNFETTYFIERRTDESVTQPHSLELQTLAELGLVGTALLAAVLAGILAGLVARARSSWRTGRTPTLTIAAGGMWLVWLAQTSVDWLHVIPGVTGIAMCGAAVLVASPAWERASGPGRVRRTIVVAGALIALFGAIMVGRVTLAETYRSNAQDALDTRPREALRHADDSLTLNGGSLPAHYVKAAAQSRLGQYRAARATLLEAARLEPHNSVPWALLGDLAVRRGDLESARRHYGRASRLNPRDTQLERLAAHPLAGQGG